MEKEILEKKKDEMFELEKIEGESLEIFKKKYEEIKDEIQLKNKERQINNYQLKKAENEQHDVDESIIY